MNAKDSCRPLRFWMVSENRELACQEAERLKGEYDALVPIEWIENVAKLSFKGFFSMIDAAFLNYITHNVSHWRCSICHLLPRQFYLIKNGNYPPLQVFPLDELAVSILHFPLRVGDHFLKIAYKQDFKKGRVSKEFQKLYNQSLDSISIFKSCIIKRHFCLSLLLLTLTNDSTVHAGINWHP